MNKELIKKIFSTKAGVILLISIILILSTSIFLIIMYFFDSATSSKLATMIFTNLFIGRVPAISFGYASNLSHFQVIAFNILAEMILVTLIYSLFVFSFDGVLKIKRLEDFFSRVQKKKEEHNEIFIKYGKLGLFIFVFIPFWMTGPIVGSIIGFLIGMKHFTVIFIVFLATIISMTLWGLFLQEIVNFIGQFDIRFIWILIAIMVVSVLILKYKKRG
ncbi:small multi-drug export protein [Campylobacterota bacterium DY0563]|uniref:small multi-drug export protein n=1 Tax=Halarcobacter sp. TaxID=2321133 RepID=UPI0029F4DBD6|nr:small multi-drug export protein [Halarcobacter sp.]